MNSFKIPPLNSGGIITNYFCTSKCRHCLYRCSPILLKNYIDSNTIKYLCEIILKKQNPILHIGGGEPFLRHEKLAESVKIILRHGLFIEYVETNSSWYKYEDSAKSILIKLKKAGLKGLLISISPFHNEYIPFSKVINVMNLAKSLSFSILPWSYDFVPHITRLDINSTHTLEEYEKIFGENYKKYIVNRYWIHPGGRAIDFLDKILPKRPLNEILKSKPCNLELENTSHFHIDLYGNYIPGLCSGLAIKIEDILNPINEQKYPLLNILHKRGIKGLYDLAKRDFGFTNKREFYLNKCHLCLEIRDFLKKEKKINFLELNPPEFYHQP
ncbi:radical SAM protein [Desulfothermus okinawensis JCM 13304]